MNKFYGDPIGEIQMGMGTLFGVPAWLRKYPYGKVESSRNKTCSSNVLACNFSCNCSWKPHDMMALNRSVMFRLWLLSSCITLYIIHYITLHDIVVHISIFVGITYYIIHYWFHIELHFNIFSLHVVLLCTFVMFDTYSMYICVMFNVLNHKILGFLCCRTNLTSRSPSRFFSMQTPLTFWTWVAALDSSVPAPTCQPMIWMAWRAFSTCRRPPDRVHSVPFHTSRGEFCSSIWYSAVTFDI